MTRTAVSALAALVLVIPALVRADTAGGAATPQALVDRLAAAGKSHDYRELALCYSPETRKMLAVGMMLGAAFGTMGLPQEKQEKAGKDLEALLAKHKVKDLSKDASANGQGDPTKAFDGVDTVAFLADIIPMVEKMPGDTKIFPAAALTDLKVTGDDATAKAGAEPVTMRKIDGRWYLHMEAKAQASTEPKRGTPRDDED